MQLSELCIPTGIHKDLVVITAKIKSAFCNFNKQIISSGIVFNKEKTMKCLIRKSNKYHYMIDAIGLFIN